VTKGEPVSKGQKCRRRRIHNCLGGDVAAGSVGDFVPGYEASAVHGVGAPHNTPAHIVEKLNRAINATLAEPAIKARLVDMGATLLPGSPDDFGKLIADETEKWAKVVKFSGAKPD
jgi:Tripartite tricarboxylate transporter family receptor